MIVRELYLEREDGVKLYRTYSDSGMKIRQDDTNYIYDEAVDVEDTLHTYTETDEPIESEEATYKDYEIALRRLGVMA